MLLEELVPMGTLLTQSNMHVRPPALQLMEPAQELHEVPPAEPQEMNIDDDDEEEEKKCGPFLDIEFHLAKDYEDLEPPGEEPPEQLLADTKEPEENQNQQEMPGTSNEVQEPLSSGAHTQAPPDEKPFSSEQLGLCSAHQQQSNIHLEIQTGKVAQEGPRDGPGPSRGSDPYGPGPSRGPAPYGPGPSRGPDRYGPGPSRGPDPYGPGPSRRPAPYGPGPSRGPAPYGPGPSRGPAPYGPGPSRGPDRYGQQFISQEEDAHVHALSSNSFTQAATVSEPEADYFDQERQQCRLCKREFMRTLGLIEHVRPQVVSRSHQCPFCGKTFRGQSHVVAHQVRHTEERPFPCNHCVKSYKHKSSLLRHLKFHTRENQPKASQGSQSAPHKASQ
ncbi:proline-rich proteoglycan 2-like [Peromyscus eremicus]|uniref:proline-rich proteoglycan 2-like n=1 Tax=Peromyscus eremicus TaxID=42410 RepID=UPI0027DD707C|nr:proline-rich proteoglycan 2-like [Peromyscus eremicus]